MVKTLYWTLALLTTLALRTSPLAGGKSLVPLLRGQPAPGRRDAALLEHHGPDFAAAAGPDAAPAGSGNPSTYEALQPIYPELSLSQVDALHSRLAELESCRGAATCQGAAGEGT